MNVFREFHAKVLDVVAGLIAAGALPAEAEPRGLTVEPPRDPAHGDITTNAAMVLARAAKRKPRDIAQLIAERLAEDDAVERAEVAGPGFVNLRLADAFWRARLADMLRAGDTYGGSDMGGGEKVNVEYVSTNPTGPLHVGHARGAVYGDALAALLGKAGYDVTREFYINDAGAQIDQLAYSTYFRYLGVLGAAQDEAAFQRLFPGHDWTYRGAYLIPLGERLRDRHGDNLARAVAGDWRPAPEAAWLEPVRDFAIDAMMTDMRDDLAALGVHQEVFSSERDLVASGRVDEMLKRLADKDLLYTGVLEPPKGKAPEDWEPRPQLLFRSTRYGDDIDRPLKKSDGSWTYFASDIAYHFGKVERGFMTLIDVWGADHGGYVKRMKAAVTALTDGKARLDVKLCQMVKLLREGQPVKMSKRAGSFITLRDVVEEVGKDVVRFIMLTRRNDAPLEFDLVRVTEQSKDNPVFYVQYAHARISSVMRNAAHDMADLDSTAPALAGADLGCLTDGDEIALIKLMAAWPRLIESAAAAHEPHRLAFYLYDLAAAFHGLWNKGKESAALRFIVAGDPELTRARLALLRGVALVIASGLTVFGVEPVEEMR